MQEEHISWGDTGVEDIHDDRIDLSSVKQHETSLEHNLLSGYISDEHIAHSIIEISSEADGGLSGSGDLTGSFTFKVDFDNTVEKVSIDNDDKILIHDSISDSLKSVKKQLISPKTNYSGVLDPDVTNDSSEGYSKGSVWINTLTDQLFTLVDSSVGTAIWSQGGSGGAIATPDYDSGWITVSSINDTLKGISASSYHEVSLPTSIFSTYPKGYTIIRDDSTNIYPVDPASTLVFSIDGSLVKVAVETTGWNLTDQFRLVCSASLTSGNGATDFESFENKTIDGDLNTITNLEHGFEVDNPTSNVHGVTGSVVGTSDFQVLTFKDIDGGTASDTNRITIPKNTTDNLDILTDKEATLAYDTDVSALVVNTGSGWSPVVSASEYTSGWIVVSSINDTLKGVSASGYHEVTLPDSFTTYPKAYTLLRDDSTNVYPVDTASTLIFSIDGSDVKVAVDANDWNSTDQFRLWLM